MPGTVKSSASRTVVENVPSFTYADGRDSLVLAAQAAAAALGREESFATLKGLSALAFRLLFPIDWRRCTPDALCGFDHTRLLFDPLGLRVSPARVSSPTYVEISRRLIVESIQKGYPVLGLHLMEWEDWGVIAGYADDGKKLLCRTPHDTGFAEESIPEEGPASFESEPPRTGPYTRHKHWPNMLLIITGEEPAPDREKSIVASLRTAVELFDTEQFGPFYSGKAAYLNWIAGLRDAAWYAAQGEPAGADYAPWIKRITRPEKEAIREDSAYGNPYLERAHVNAWRLESLIDARRAAASYLQSIAMRFDNPVSEKLNLASGRYTWLAGLLANIRSFVAWDDELDQTPWTQTMRERQAELLSTARFVEEQGVAEIREVLDALGKG
jgi:hypothetical protein